MIDANDLEKIRKAARNDEMREVAQIIANKFRDKPDDHITSIGDWHVDPLFGAPIEEFHSYIKIPMSDWRKWAGLSMPSPQTINALNTDLIARANGYLSILAPHAAARDGAQIMRQLVDALSVQHPVNNKTAPDLAALVSRLVRALKKAAPNHDLPDKAMDYLKRHGLLGSPLRAPEELQPADHVADKLGMVEPVFYVDGVTARVYLQNPYSRQALISIRIGDFVHESDVPLYASPQSQSDLRIPISNDASDTARINWMEAQRQRINANIGRREDETLRQSVDAAMAATKSGGRMTERTLNIGKRVLDPCCGSRMFWFDRQNTDVIFGDKRNETHVLCDGRTLRIEPDMLLDFTDLPFADGSFNLVVFDPPHLHTAGPKSWMAAKYGKLSKTWQEDLRKGFVECFRVLASDGVLVFKWNETQVKIHDVLALTDVQPLFGHPTGRKGLTHWYVFMKPKFPCGSAI